MHKEWEIAKEQRKRFEKTATLTPPPFCRHFGIDIDTQLKFIRPEIEANALYLKLGETVSVGGRKRKKK